MDQAAISLPCCQGVSSPGPCLRSSLSSLGSRSRPSLCFTWCVCVSAGSPNMEHAASTTQVFSFIYHDTGAQCTSLYLAPRWCLRGHCLVTLPRGQAPDLRSACVLPEPWYAQRLLLTRSSYTMSSIEGLTTQAAQNPLSVETHRICLIFPAMMTNACVKLPPGETPKRLSTKVFVGGRSHRHVP